MAFGAGRWPGPVGAGSVGVAVECDDVDEAVDGRGDDEDVVVAEGLAQRGKARFELTTIEPVSYREATSWKHSDADAASKGR